MIDRTLYAEDIAQRLRVDVATARRWLADLERQYGATIVGRRGRALYTTDTAMARVRPAWCESKVDISLLYRIADRVGRLWRRVTVLGSDLHELKGSVAKLTERVSEIQSPMQRTVRT